ncbi:MAG: DUF1707 domain-containing protein [Kofleriaceae bacterium]|nr:DUF1707 domain-containing protein [Kofleriaceae bacterium]
MADPIPAKLLAPAVLAQQRETVVQQLTDAFAADIIDVEEFERRIGLAHQSNEPTALQRLVQDLPESTSANTAASLAVSPAQQVVALARTDTQKSMTVILSSVNKDGPWQVPALLKVRAALGASVLDFRQAQFDSAHTELRLHLSLGNVEIIVPPTMNVEIDATAILGSIERKGPAPTAPIARGPNTPTLRITGYAILSSVEISTRLPGESSGDARRRSKQERKQQKQLKP